MTVSPYTLESYNSIEAWLYHWGCQYKEHFQSARNRIEPVYETEFASFSAVSKRHWHHRRDIPQDLLTLPRSLWRGANKLVKRNTEETSATPTTGKSEAVANIIEHELLKLTDLQTAFADHLIKHPNFIRADLESLEKTLSQVPVDTARQKLMRGVDSLSQTHEGGRDFLLFVAIGLLGRGIVDKAAFGSAAALGSAAATSIYLSKQSFLASVWMSWAGTPTWVSAAGAIGGVGSTILLTPLIAPLTEYSVNKLRAKKLLHGIVNQAESKVAINEKDLAKFAGQFGTYAQLLPDLVQILKHLK